MKLFEFSVGDERIWIAAKTLLMAVGTLFDYTAMPTSIFTESDDVKEVPREKWDGLVVYSDKQMLDETTFTDAIAALQGAAGMIAVQPRIFGIPSPETTGERLLIRDTANPGKWIAGLLK